MALSTKRRTERARDWEYRAASPRTSGETVVVDGFGVSVRVNRSRLVVADGTGRARNERRYGRATNDIARVVVLGGTGTLSLEAVRWLTSVGAGIVCIDRDGKLLLTSAPTRSEAKLRRAQALALFNETGLEIARTLLHAKVAGQRQVAIELDSSAVAIAAIERSLDAVDGAKSLHDVRFAEAEAAAAYWSCWRTLEVPFQRSDLPRIPDHWRRFGPRQSPLASGPRLAVAPGGALLNYLYALLESEARLACLTIGLDPALSIVHADDRGRDSLPLDLMEAVRPDVDRYLLDLIRSRVFRVSDFYETRRGNCRILAPLTHELAETLPTWRNLIGPVTEQVAKLLTRHSVTSERLPTRLTAANRHAANARRHGHRVPPAESPAAPRPEKRCKRCGGRLPNQRRVYCDACLPHVQRDRYDALIATGQTAYRKRLAEKTDTSHRGTAAERRARSVTQRMREQREWEAANPDAERDPDVFQREILPAIKAMPLSDLARATRLGRAYLADIRRGAKVPHPRHWLAFRAIEER